MDINQLSQFGVAGLAVFLMYKISSNHINHNTKAFEKLTEVINDLLHFLKNGK